MPASSRSTTPPVTDHAEQVEKVDPERALQQRLGLRPTFMEGETPSADQRPCPSWCEMVTHPLGRGHDFNPSSPSYSTHTLYPAPTVRASLYAALEHSGPPAITTAHVEVDLYQNGTSPPAVKLTLLRPAVTTGTPREERLRLTLDDAYDLRAALSYVLEIAESDQ